MGRVQKMNEKEQVWIRKMQELMQQRQSVKNLGQADRHMQVERYKIVQYNCLSLQKMNILEIYFEYDPEQSIR